MRNIFRDVHDALGVMADGLFDVWDSVFEDNPQNMSYDFLDVLEDTYREEIEEEELVAEEEPTTTTSADLHVPLTSIPVYVPSANYRAIEPPAPKEEPPPPKTRFTEIILPPR